MILKLFISTSTSDQAQHIDISA